MRNKRGVETQPEHNSGIPLEAHPAMHNKPESIQDMMARFVQAEFLKRAQTEDVESPEDADDFEEESPDIIPLTHHEVMAMDVEELQDYSLVPLVDDTPRESDASDQSGSDFETKVEAPQEMPSDRTITPE